MSLKALEVLKRYNIISYALLSYKSATTLPLDVSLLSIFAKRALLPPPSV